MKRIYGLSVFASAAVVALVCAAPAHAGSWQLTSSVSGTDTAGSWGTGILTLSQSSTSYSFEDVFDDGSIESGSYIYSGSIQWTGGGTQPSSVTLTETGEATADALYTSTATQNVSDGLGDPQNSSIDTTYAEPPSVADESTGTHTTVVPIAPGAIYTFTRTLSASSTGGAINECFVSYSISIQ